MCNEAKKKCIYAVSKELGVDVDWQGLGKLSDEQASQRIDQLKNQLEKSNGGPDKNSDEQNHEFNCYRFGMVAKIVFDKFPYDYLRARPNVFTQEVRRIYDMVGRAEAGLKDPDLEQTENIVPSAQSDDMKNQGGE